MVKEKKESKGENEESSIKKIKNKITKIRKHTNSTPQNGTIKETALHFANKREHSLIINNKLIIN